ncbi:MAG: PilX protein [Candidatus Poribacteria bacterium]|nr:PilX protein [Candidatus Poribacteria bacterium]
MNITLKNINSLFQRAFWIRYPKDKRGFVLVLTLMLISLLSVLAITSFELVTATTRITGNHKRYLQALYAADAGIEHTVYVLKEAEPWSLTWGDQSSLSGLSLDIKDEDTNNWNFISNNWTMSNSETGNNYTITLTIDPDPSVQKILVESTGIESGFSKTVQAEIENSPIRITRWMEKEM